MSQLDPYKVLLILMIIEYLRCALSIKGEDLSSSLCGADGFEETVGTCLDPGKVTLVLSVFKRQYLYEQLKRALQQSHPPSSLFIYQNERHVDVDYIVDNFRAYEDTRGVPIHLVRSDENFKYHGRFMLPLAFKTEFTCIWDDDILPGYRWLEYVQNASLRLGGPLIGGNGRNIIEVGKNVLQEAFCDSCGKLCSERQVCWPSSLSTAFACVNRYPQAV
jgi:hypothetical protein